MRLNPCKRCGELHHPFLLCWAMVTVGPHPKTQTVCVKARSEETR